MEAQKRLIAIALAIVLAVFSAMSPPLYLSVLLLLFGFFILAWGFARDDLRTFLEKIPYGHFVNDWMENFEGVLESRDSFHEERKQYVDEAFAKLTPEDLRWVRKMLVGSRPVGIPGYVGNSIGSAGLLEYDFTGIVGIRSDLKHLVAEKLRSTS
jgi:hypothetical protein